MIIYRSQLWRDARLEGGLRYFLSTGTLHGLILEVFDGVIPVDGATPVGNLLATMLLDDPAFVAHALVLTQTDPAGDLIIEEGDATFGRLISPNGDWACDGDITVEGGGGVFELTGTTGTHLYAGARAILGTTGIV